MVSPAFGERVPVSTTSAVIRAALTRVAETSCPTIRVPVTLTFDAAMDSAVNDFVTLTSLLIVTGFPAKAAVAIKANTPTVLIIVRWGNEVYGCMHVNEYINPNVPFLVQGVHCVPHFERYRTPPDQVHKASFGK